MLTFFDWIWENLIKILLKFKGLFWHFRFLLNYIPQKS